MVGIEVFGLRLLMNIEFICRLLGFLSLESYRCNLNKTEDRIIVDED